MKTTQTFYFFCFFSTLLLHAENKEKTVIYSPIGKRDPFRAPLPNQITRDPSAVGPLEKFSMEQLQLKAILRGGGKNRVMFEDPEGKTHILFEGETVGRERALVSRILNTGIIVTKKTVNYLGVDSISEEVISLPNDELDLYGKKKSQ